MSLIRLDSPRRALKNQRRWRGSLSFVRATANRSHALLRGVKVRGLALDAQLRSTKPTP